MQSHASQRRDLPYAAVVVEHVGTGGTRQAFPAASA